MSTYLILWSGRVNYHVVSSGPGPVRLVSYDFGPIGYFACSRTVQPYGTQVPQALDSASWRRDMLFGPLVVYSAVMGKDRSEFWIGKLARRHVSCADSASLSGSGKVAWSGPLIMVVFNDGDVLAVTKIFLINRVMGVLSLSLFSFFLLCIPSDFLIASLLFW